MKDEEGGVSVYPYLMKASAHNQSLVERVPAGRVFSWCKLSIRSEEQKYKEACVKDWIPTQRTREGGSRRDLNGIYLHFPLCSFQHHFSCHPSGCCGVDSSVFLRSLLLLIKVSVWGRSERGHHWKHGAAFSSGVFFLVFLLDWFMFVGCVKELKLIIIDLIFEMS